MQDTDERRQAEEPRVRLQQHALHLVELRARTAALRLHRLLEPMGHRRKHLELHERHRLEDDLQREARRRGVELDVVVAEVPELVREDDGLVEAACARFVALIGDEVHV